MTDAEQLAVVHVFLERYLDDRARGVTRPLADYQAAFPGYEQCIAEQFAELHPTSPDPATELVIGPYRVLRELGAGGQAVVYLAEDERLRRQVALKVLPRDVATAEQQQRLRREAQVAARRQDPGVAEVFEVGSDRAHFFVAMRYVAGETLAARIERDRRLRGAGHCVRLVDDASEAAALRLVLEAFVTLLHSLERAHRDGVVHRDVKPGNLMITPSGRPVLLDFGLARDAGSDLPTLTRTGDLFGTPAYLAPELISGQLARADAGTDVYAVAVTLYEALTLERPFVAPTREALFHAVLAGDVVDVRRRNGRLPRDLAVVVATGLARDRARRYRTAADFADDLQRVQDGLTISARPPSLRRRVSAACRRHPALAAGALVVFLAAGALLVQQQLRVAEVSAARDEIAAVNSFLIGELLLSVGPERARGTDLRVAEVLDRAAASVDESFAADSASGATVRHLLGDAYASISRFAEARRWFAAALAIRERLFGERAEESMQSAQRLAQMELAVDEFDAAEQRFASLVARSTSVLGADNLRTLRARLGVAHVDFARGRFAEIVAALPALEAAAAGRDEDLRLDAAEVRARALVRLDRRAEAEPVLRAILADRTATGGGDPLRLQNVRNDLGSLLHDRALERREPAAWDEAQHHYAEALQHAESLFGPDHEQTAISCNNYGLLLKDRAAQLGEQPAFAAAKTLLERSLELRRKLYGDDSTRVATAVDSLAGLHHDLGEFAVAARLYEECWDMRVRLLGPDHPLTLTSSTSLGASLLRAGMHGEACERFAGLLPLLDAQPSVDRGTLLIAYYYGGKAAMAIGDVTLARQRLERALALALDAFGERSRQVEIVRGGLQLLEQR